MARHIDADVAVHTHPEHGEGPVWDDDDSSLLWVDLPRGQVHRFRPGSGDEVALDLGEQVGSVALRRGGGLVIAQESGIALSDSDGAAELVAPIIADDPAVRFNDGKCDPAGRFFAGTMAHDQTPGAGMLYRFDPDQSVTAALGDLTISNGLAWSADQRTMYFIDTPTGGVDALDYDLDTGALGTRRRIIDVPQAQGWPDGMAIDAEGCLWVALYDGAAVHRYTPDGRLDAIVAFPVTKTTSCVFGGPGLDVLYVTTSTERFTAEQYAEQPLAGAVFACDPGVVGLPADRFAG